MPLAVVSVDQWRWHLCKVPLVVAACAAWRGAEQKHVSTDGQQAEQGL